MTDERFNELLSGPLSHPMIHLHINRLCLALRITLQAGGEASEKALEECCAAWEKRDEEERDA